MIIGLTFDLQSEYLAEGFTREEVAEFDKEETIFGIEQSLQRLGHTTLRIGSVKRLTERLVKGERWDLVFNICEGVYGIGREAQVPAILDAYRIPYTFSDPLVLSLTLHKGIMKRVVRDMGVATPDFNVISAPSDIVAIAMPFPLFLKPVAEGSGKAISEKSVVHNRKELEEQALHLLESSGQPVLAEEFLPGREFTTGIIGTGDDASALGTIEINYNEHVKTKIYSYDIKNEYEKFVTYIIPDTAMCEQCAELALTVWRGIGGRDAGRVDIRLDKNGKPNFIELNPLAGMNYIHSDLPIIAYRNGLTYDYLMERIIRSATQRS
jgi:D-alanine-D-alanine ligase